VVALRGACSNVGGKDKEEDAGVLGKILSTTETKETVETTTKLGYHQKQLSVVSILSVVSALSK
jgi:hypothetical protein